MYAGRGKKESERTHNRQGIFYWVRANVTPVVEDGDLKGFISIRIRPERDEVAAAEGGYAAIREQRGRGLHIKAGALVRSGLTARWERVARGIASSFAVNLGVLYAAIGGSLAAGAVGI